MRSAFIAVIAFFLIGATDTSEMDGLVRGFLTDAARLRQQGLSTRERAALQQDLAAKGAALKNARKQMRLASNAKRPATESTGSSNASKDLERCEACKNLWGRIVSKTIPKSEQDIVDEFKQVCTAPTKLYYNACEDMYDDIYNLGNAYLMGGGAQEVCQKAQMCVNPAPAR